MKLNRKWGQVMLGIGGVFLITFPFVWLKLDYDYIHGTIGVIWAGTKGLKLFMDSLPILGGAVAIWLLGRLYLRFSSKLSVPFQIMGKWERQMVLGAWLVCLVGVFCLGNSGLSMAIFVGLWMIQALGLNIAIGMTGLLVLGYAGFYAMGGYTFAVAQKFFPFITWWMALPLAIAIGGVTGWIVGLPCLRLRGDYLAIVTLGFGECFRELVRNWSKVTGGDQGLNIAQSAKIQPCGPLSSTQMTYLMVALSVFLVIAFCHRLSQSWVGRAWVAIREDEIAASAVGIPVVQMKLLAFVVSSSVGAVAGVLYVAYTGFIDPAACVFENSVMVLAMVILGGLGSILGVILGSALLYLIPSLLRDNFPGIADYRLLLFGLIMVAMMLWRPQGLLGSRRRQLEIKAN